MSLSPEPLTLAEIQVRNRLESLGFRLSNPADKYPSWWFSVAIREFQTYARMEKVAFVKNPAATSWVAQLAQTKNDSRYNGAIDGIYTAALGDVIKYWEDHHYRCPVVADLYIQLGKQPSQPLDTNAPAGNYWRWDDPRIAAYVRSQLHFVVPVKAWRQIYQRIKLKVYDFDRFYDAGKQEATAFDAGFLSYLPTSIRYGKPPGKSKLRPFRKTREFVGPVSAATRSSLAKLDANCEVLPQSLLSGKKWEQITDVRTRSTFRVIRAVSEQECLGYLDCINAYDNTGISFGLYHWAMSAGEAPRNPDQETEPTLAELKVASGELQGALALWAAQYPDESKQALSLPYGMEVIPPWVRGQPGQDQDGADDRSHWASSRSYHGWAMAPHASPEELAQFRTSHWFWRFTVMLRNEPTLRSTLWDMARIRIRDVLAYQIDPSDRPGSPSGSKKVPLSKMFTSELAVALLIRCHVRGSGFLAASKYEKTANLRMALAFAGNSSDVDNWKDPEQLRLIQGMIATAAMTELSGAESKLLMGLKPAEIWAKRDILANARGTFGDLRKGCDELSEWPSAAGYQWNYPGPQPRARAPYALPRAACERPLRAPEQPAQPPAVGLASWPGSFKLDDSGLPPMPPNT